MQYLLKQSQTARPLLFLMVDLTDHVSPKTGLVSGSTLTVTLSKNGGAFNPPAGSVSEVGSGWYAVAGNATDAGSLGPLLLHATGTGADPTDAFYEVVAFDPTDAVRLGLSALPNASAGASGGLAAIDSSLRTLAKVDAYSSGQDPATLLLVTPANKLATDSSNRVTVGSNADKTGYALTSGEHTTIAADTQTGLTNQGYTTTRAPYLDTLNGLVQAIWDKATSALSTVGSIGKLLVDNINASISAVKAKTDNLPAAPASTGDVTTAEAAIIAALPAAPHNAQIDAIKAKTDNLPAAPASTGDVTTAEAAIIAALPSEPPTVAEIDTQLTGTHGAGTWQQGNMVAPATPDDLAAATAAILAQTDVPTSTRSSHSAADVWAVGTRTLTGFGSLVADVAAAVWAAASRTLTALGFSPAGVVAVTGPVQGGKIHLYRGTAYLSAYGRALVFVDSTNTWPDLPTGDAGSVSLVVSSLTALCVVDVATGPAKQVHCDLTAAQVAQISIPGIYALLATYADRSADPVLLARDECRVDGSH